MDGGAGEEGRKNREGKTLTSVIGRKTPVFGNTFSGGVNSFFRDRVSALL